MSVVLTVWSAFIFFRAFIPFHCAVFFHLLKHLLFLEIDLKPGLACPLFLWTRSCHGYLIICAHLTGLWSDERRWSVPFSIDAAGITRVTKQKAVHFGFKTLFARKVLWIVLCSALIVLTTALLHLIAAVHVFVSRLPLSCESRTDIITAHLSFLSFLLGYFLLEINACQCACEISWGSSLNGAVKTRTDLVSWSNPTLFPETHCTEGNRGQRGWGVHAHQLLAALLCKYLHGKENKWRKRNMDMEQSRYRTSGRTVFFRATQEGLMKQGKQHHCFKLLYLQKVSSSLISTI